MFAAWVGSSVVGLTFQLQCVVAAGPLEVYFEVRGFQLKAVLSCTGERFTWRFTRYDIFYCHWRQ